MKTYHIDPNAINGQYHATPTQAGPVIEIVLGPTVAISQNPSEADPSFNSTLGNAPVAGDPALASEVE